MAHTTTTVTQEPGRVLSEGDLLPIVILRCTGGLILKGELVATDLHRTGRTAIRIKGGETVCVKHENLIGLTVVSTGMAA
jgi:hypothetical protein